MFKKTRQIFINDEIDLFMAIKVFKFRESIPELIKQGANPNLTNLLGNTPLHLACLERCESDVIKHLIDGGAHVDAINLEGQTPLYIACEMGYYELLPTLLKEGAIVNRVIDADGNTVLHKVFMSKKETIMPLQDLLIRYGADLNIKNNLGKTPLDLALDKNNCIKLEWSLKSGHIFNVKRESSLRNIAIDCSAATPLLKQAVTHQLQVFGKYFAYKMSNNNPKIPNEIIRRQLHFLWGDDQYYKDIIDNVMTAFQTKSKSTVKASISLGKCQ